MKSVGWEIEHLQKKLAHTGDMGRNISLKLEVWLETRSHITLKKKSYDWVKYYFEGP